MEQNQKPKYNVSLIAAGLAIISVIFTAAMTFSETDFLSRSNEDKVNEVVDKMEDKFDVIDDTRTIVSGHEIRITNIERQNEVALAFQNSIRKSMNEQAVTSKEIQTDIKYIKAAINELKDRK